MEELVEKMYQVIAQWRSGRVEEAIALSHLTDLSLKMAQEVRANDDQAEWRRCPLCGKSGKQWREGAVVMSLTLTVPENKEDSEGFLALLQGVKNEGIDRKKEDSGE